jgi:tetratricopeptide (TPR) repeat protein
VRSRRRQLVAAIGLALALACAGRGPGGELRRGPLRISDVADEGDVTRRASTRLVLAGLASDAAAKPGFAASQYERAIQIDPTNPFAYLALARHYDDRADPARTLEYLDQAEILLESQGLDSIRIEPHIAGLRGSALQRAGRFAEAEPLLARAETLAPSEWGDGRLSPEELR